MHRISEHQAALDQAEQHLSEGEERVARQAEIVARLRERGHDARLAQSLLCTFIECLGVMCTHRDVEARAVSQGRYD